MISVLVYIKGALPNLSNVDAYKQNSEEVIIMMSVLVYIKGALPNLRIFMMYK